MKRKKLIRIGKTAVIAVVLASSSLIVSCGSRKEETELRMTAIGQLDAGNYEEAISTFDLALEAAGGRVGKMELDILKYRGEAEYKAGDYEAAAHTWDVLLQVDEKLPEYLYARSMAKAGAGKTEEALADYEEAASMEVRMDRKVFGREEALIAVGKACEAAGDVEAASRLYEKALAEGIGQDNAGVWNTLAMACMEEEKYEEALPFLEKGIASGDESLLPDLLFNRAVVYEYTGEWKKALEAFQAYERAYGPDEEAQREITFLRTRQNGG